MKKLSHTELAEFCNQMGLLLPSGISVREGLVLLLEDTHSEDESLLYNTLITRLDETGFLHEAVVDLFPAYAVHMIRLGEETGSLDQIMIALSRHYTREVHFRTMLKSAILYPSVLLFMMLLILLVLLVKVMPVFQQVFRQLGQEMTGLSAALLLIGQLLSRYSIVFLLLMILVVLFLCFYGKHLPFRKKILEKIAVCRFCEGMSIALKSGITPEEGLRLVAALTQQTPFSEKIRVCMDKTAEGKSLSVAIHESKILTGTYARMVSLGDRTGKLDEVLAQIAEEYDTAAQNQITGLIARIEPTLVIILSLVAGSVLFSVMMPLLGILSGM